MKRALVTGVNGQDGSYLCEFLLKQGYEVHGVIRSAPLKFGFLEDKITPHILDLTNQQGVSELFKNHSFDECYHLAGFSFVNHNLEDEFKIIENNFHATHYILSSIKKFSPQCKLFFAGSSEMFGEAKESPQNEETPFHPKTIYGISKLSSYHLLKNYREKEGIFAATGILFNHESPRRGESFVTKKIVQSAVKIKKGLEKELFLGNLDAQRDWGYAPDFVEGMHKILQLDTPDDFILATGELTTIKEFLEIAFSYLDLNYEDYVKVDEKFFRPSEKNPLLGDPSKIKAATGWENSKPLEAIIREMIDYEMEMTDG